MHLEIRAASSVYGAKGKVKKKAVPPSAPGWLQSLPPFSLMKARHNERPSPTPCGLVVKKGWKGWKGWKAWASTATLTATRMVTRRRRPSDVRQSPVELKNRRHTEASRLDEKA